MPRSANPTPPLLHAILAQGAVKATHGRLSEVARISDRSVDNKIAELYPIRALRGGRPVTLGPGLGAVLSISLGSESLRAALVDANGEMHCLKRDEPRPEQLDASPQALLSRLRQIGVRVLSAAMAKEDLWSGDKPSLRLLGVAVAWPVPVDRTKRPGGSALGDPSWTRADARGVIMPLTERVARAFDPPFTTEHSHALNDVNAQALATAFADARARALEPDDKEERWRIAMVVRVGGGLGAATIQLAPHRQDRLSFIDSRLIVGANGLAGELGHLPVSQAIIDDRNENIPFPRLAKLNYEDGTCSCGRRHHLEAFASAAALVRRLQDSGYEIPDQERGGTSLIRTLFDGDPDQEQLHAVRDVGRILGSSLAGPVLMLDPHSITLTGSLASEDLKQGVLRERERWGHAIGDSARIRYVDGVDGAFAGVRGAGLAVIRNHVHRQIDNGVVTIRKRSFEFGPNDLARLANGSA